LNSNKFRKRTTKIDTTVWSETKRSSRWNIDACVAVATKARSACHATQLEWDNHLVTETNIANGLANCNNFPDHFMTHDKRGRHWIQTKRNSWI
jgi:hypothetical protein